MNGRLFGFLFAGAIALVIALSTGTNIYYYLFFTMLFVLLLALLSVLTALFSVHAQLTGAKGRVTRGEKVPLILTVRHAALLPVSYVRIYLKVPESAGNRAEIDVNSPPFAARQFRYTMACAHRGIYSVGIERIVVSDVFGLFTIGKKASGGTARVEVLPRLTRVNSMDLSSGDDGPESHVRSVEDTASPSGIRAWQDGDELKKVHWKLTMKRREVVVRTYEESARPDTLIIADLAPVEAVRDLALSIEDTVCEACLNLAVAQLGEDFPVRMPLMSAAPAEVNGTTSADTGAFSDALMRVGFDSPYPYEQVLLLMMARMPRTGGVVLVTPKLTMRIADMAIRMRRSGVKVALVWVTDTQKSEASELIARLEIADVIAKRVNPWNA